MEWTSLAHSRHYLLSARFALGENVAVTTSFRVPVCVQGRQSTSGRAWVEAAQLHCSSCRLRIWHLMGRRRRHCLPSRSCFWFDMGGFSATPASKTFRWSYIRVQRAFASNLLFLRTLCLCLTTAYGLLFSFCL